MTGDLVDGAELDAGYWWRNVRQPVLFAAAFGQIMRSAPGIVVEIGPHPVLAPSIDEALAERSSQQPGATVRPTSTIRLTPPPGRPPLSG